MFFRASMDSKHGSASTKLADWPQSECHLQHLAPSFAADAVALAEGGAQSQLQPVHPSYPTKFAPFVLRPDNKIWVQDGSSRDSSSTMLKARFHIFRNTYLNSVGLFCCC
jgi:hypothetical protein